MKGEGQWAYLVFLVQPWGMKWQGGKRRWEIRPYREHELYRGVFPFRMDDLLGNYVPGTLATSTVPALGPPVTLRRGSHDVEQTPWAKDHGMSAFRRPWRRPVPLAAFTGVPF